MKKLALKSLDGYRLSVEEKKQVMGGGFEFECNIRQVLCDCGSGQMWYAGSHCPSGCRGGYSPECPSEFPELA